MLGGDACPRPMTGGSKQDLSYGFNLVPAWLKSMWPGVRRSLSSDLNSVVFFFFFPGCVARHVESLVPQPDSLVPPEWNHGTGPPGNSPNVVFKIMIYMTCTSGTQLLEINQNGDETEGCKKPAQ